MSVNIEKLMYFLILCKEYLLANVKDKDEPNNRQGAVYNIKFFDCQASYIGETGRNLKPLSPPCFKIHTPLA